MPTFFFLPFCFSGLCVSPVVMSSLRLSSPPKLHSQNAADPTHAPTLGHRRGIWQEQKNGFSLEKPVLLEVAVRHRPAQRTIGLCSECPCRRPSAPGRGGSMGRSRGPCGSTLLVGIRENVRFRSRSRFFCRKVFFCCCRLPSLNFLFFFSITVARATLIYDLGRCTKAGTKAAARA